MKVANPRELCVTALIEWEGSREFSDDILHRTLTGDNLTALDRGFLTECFYGVLRNLRLLDFLISQLNDSQIDPRTRQILRLGIYQLFYMRVPEHAAVFESVELAGRARKFVNALLRRGIREREQLEEAVRCAAVAVRFSHPDFLVERWKRHFGETATQELCLWNNQPAEIFVRPNSLKTSAGELLQNEPDAQPVEGYPLSLKVARLPASWLTNGLCYVQDPSTLIACELLAPLSGEVVLDACAAPGGKTSRLAELMNNQGQIFACDSSMVRIKRLEENLARLGVTNTTTKCVDWINQPNALPAESFDRILLDAPCSNTGVIRRRVDVRWRLTPQDFDKMQRVQFAIFKGLVPLLRKNGTIVYSTCSLEPEENEHISERIAREFPNLQRIETRASLPFRDGFDGAYAAKFVRVS